MNTLVMYYDYVPPSSTLAKYSMNREVHIRHLASVCVDTNTNIYNIYIETPKQTA